MWKTTRNLNPLANIPNCDFLPKKIINFNERFIAVPMMKVQTVAGMLTNLPCNITPSGQFQLPVPNIEINLNIYFNKRKLKFNSYMYVLINKN